MRGTCVRCGQKTRCPAQLAQSSPAHEEARLPTCGRPDRRVAAKRGSRPQVQRRMKSGHACMRKRRRVAGTHPTALRCSKKSRGWQCYGNGGEPLGGTRYGRYRDGASTWCQVCSRLAGGWVGGWVGPTGGSPPHRMPKRATACCTPGRLRRTRGSRRAGGRVGGGGGGAAGRRGDDVA